MSVEINFDPVAQATFWNHMRSDCLPKIITSEEYRDRKDILKQIEQDVKKGRYSPKPLYALLSVPKGKGVARFVPVLHPHDYATYFACIKAIDSELSGWRLKNTFGGWTLSGTYRDEEVAQVEEIVDEFILDDAPDYYGGISSYNKYAWMKYWRKFWQLARLYTLEVDDYYCASLDIANFYDSIELPRLERFLRYVCKDASDAIEVLMFLLSYWNREINMYAPSSKGLPQDVIGDCSRILANFYLHRFDKAINDYCASYGHRFLRFSDDMYIISKEKESLEHCVFFASQELNKIGLNLNTSKTRVFTKTQFESHWRFDIFEDFENESTVEQGLHKLRQCYKNDGFGRVWTALQTALSKIYIQDLGPDWRSWICSAITETADYILMLSPKQIERTVIMSDDCLNLLDKIAYAICSRPYAIPQLSFVRALVGLSKKSKGLACKFGLPYLEALELQSDPILLAEAVNLCVDK